MLGSEDDCGRSLRIIQRTSKSPQRPVKTKKSRVVETFDEMPADEDEEEQEQDQEEEEELEEEEDDQKEESDIELDSNGENVLVIQTEPSAFEEKDEETNSTRGEPLSVISTNTVSTKETSVSFYF